MNIIETKAEYSPIVLMDEKLNRYYDGRVSEYLPLHRAVNDICSLDIQPIVTTFDFNTVEIQTYPPVKGRLDLVASINKAYFNEKAQLENILVIPGGICGVDLSIQILNIKKFFISQYYWGPYTEIVRIRNKNYSFYDSYNFLFENINSLKDSAVIICDPNNPIGDKYPDDKLIELIECLDKHNIPIILDIPYRKLLVSEPDIFYESINKFQNVIIIESFSKSMGLSGQRIGFMYSPSTNLIKEATKRLLYETLGTNTFAQMLTRDLLSTEKGQTILSRYRADTVEHIKRNINYLFDRKIIATQFYQETFPIGVFVIIDITEDELLSHQIGSLSLSHFTEVDKNYAKQFSRICVEVNNEKFVKYFLKLEK